MSKAVLISINPEWCEMIAHGIKTVEVRKTRPKIETPFKCYIYCTLPKRSGDIYLAGNRNPVQGNGKIIGEFICDWITSLKADSATQAAYNARHNTCLNADQIMQYANGGKLYYWHISDLVIYDRPRAICQFNYPYYKDCDIPCRKCKYGVFAPDMLEEYICVRELNHAPQSWCYVEQEG